MIIIKLFLYEVPHSPTMLMCQACCVDVLSEDQNENKMRWNTMFITAVCVIFLIKLRWP